MFTLYNNIRLYNNPINLYKFKDSDEFTIGEFNTDYITITEEFIIKEMNKNVCVYNRTI